MAETAYAETVRRVSDGGVSPTTTVIAMKMLAAASPDCGMLRLTWEEFLDLTGCENRNAARRHLTRLAKIGAIHYETNSYVRVDFLAWAPAPPDARQRADRAAEAQSADNHDAPPDARWRAGMRGDAPPDARQRAENDRSRVRVELSYIDPIDPDQITQLNPEPQPPADNEPTDPARRWLFRLLTDPEIDISAEKALDITRLHTPAYALRYVSNWWRNRATLDPGVLVWRMMNFQKSKPGQIWQPFLATEFYLRHYPLTPEQIRQRAYDPDPPPLQRWITQLPEPVSDPAGGAP